MAVVKPATTAQTDDLNECSMCGSRVVAVRFCGHTLVGCRSCKWYADAYDCPACD